MKKILIYIFLLSLTTFVFPLDNNPMNIIKDSYITDEDGVIRMNINIMGHVSNPGTYLVYDGIDIMSALSIAGGFLPGTKTDKVIIYKYNGKKKIINLTKILNNDILYSDLVLDPRDTIYLEQTISSKFMSSNIVPLFVSILNLAITLDRD